MVETLFGHFMSLWKREVVSYILTILVMWKLRSGVSRFFKRNLKSALFLNKIWFKFWQKQNKSIHTDSAEQTCLWNCPYNLFLNVWFPVTINVCSSLVCLCYQQRQMAVDNLWDFFYCLTPAIVCPQHLRKKLQDKCYYMFGMTTEKLDTII